MKTVHRPAGPYLRGEVPMIRFVRLAILGVPLLVGSVATAHAQATAKVWENYDFVPGNKVIFFTDFSEDKGSEEHTSELQSPCNLVCRLLLEKKKICKYSAV